MSTMTMADTAFDTADTRSHAFVHARIMLRRNLRHMQRYPSLTLMITLMPLVFLLLFVYVFGGTLGSGLGGGMPAGMHGGRSAYADYVAPAIILMAVAAAAQGTAIAVAQDMTEGIIARFRTMAISRASVLTGHVVAAVARTMVSIGLVIGVALLMGFRPAAGPVEWLAAIGVITLLVLALTWPAVAIGLLAKNPEGTTSFTLIAQVLPFISSAFVPPDSMSGAVRWFAENEPFTPIIDTLRGLLMGTPIGNNGIVAVAWCVSLALGGYLWAQALFSRDPVR
jgi:ABC-2 type transport system permease protein